MESYEVGFWIYSHSTNYGNVKEWPVARWKELSVRLGSNGIICCQLGALFEEKLEWAQDYRKESILDSARDITNMDTVVTVEGVAGHIARAVQKRIIVLWGKSNKVWLTGYSLHNNIISDSDCGCYGSVDIASLRKDCKRNCMLGISVDRVYDAVMEELGI